MHRNLREGMPVDEAETFYQTQAVSGRHRAYYRRWPHSDLRNFYVLDFIRSHPIATPQAYWDVCQKP